MLFIYHTWSDFVLHFRCTWDIFVHLHFKYFGLRTGDLRKSCHLLETGINPLVYFECLDDFPSLYKLFFMQKIIIIYQMATILNRRSLSRSFYPFGKFLPSRSDNYYWNFLNRNVDVWWWGNFGLLFQEKSNEGAFLTSRSGSFHAYSPKTWVSRGKN